MAKAPRPGTTPTAREQREQSNTITIAVDGSRHTLRFDEITAADVRALRAATGEGIKELAAKLGESPDLCDISTIVWLARRQAGETTLTLAEVDDSLQFGDLVAAALTADAAEADPHPNPSGDS